MTETSDTPTRSGWKIPLLAAGLATAILGAAGTYSAWVDSITIDGGTITTGNLDVEWAGDDAFDAWDVTEWRTAVDGTTPAPVTGDLGHAIADLGAHRIVPGDTIQLSQAGALALEGDNMMADLTLVADDPTSVNALWDAEMGKGVTVTYRIFDRAGNLISGDTPVPWGQTATTKFATATGDATLPENQQVSKVALAESIAQNTNDFQVVVTAHFDETVTERVLTGAQAFLGALDITAAQTTGATAPADEPIVAP